MRLIAGVYFPDDTRDEKWRYSLTHVHSIEWAMAQCQRAGRTRTTVQAGGNIGLWPKRLAAVFARVISFEPDAIARECLLANAPATVDVRAQALGDRPGRCGIKHRSLGSHQVIDGDAIEMVTLDSLGLTDVDYLQLDIEGYEMHALLGAAATIQRCQPLLQLEFRNHTEKYGSSDRAVRELLEVHSYREVSKQPGADVVFAPRKWKVVA